MARRRRSKNSYAQRRSYAWVPLTASGNLLSTGVGNPVQQITLVAGTAFGGTGLFAENTVRVERVIIQLIGKAVISVLNLIFAIIASYYFKDENDTSTLDVTPYAAASDQRERRVHQEVTQLFGGPANTAVPITGPGGQQGWLMDFKVGRKIGVDELFVLNLGAYRVAAAGFQILVAPDQIDYAIVGKTLVSQRGGSP
jgi:hypothetical protein